MRAMIFQADAAEQHKRMLQLYLRDSRDCRSYGPLVLNIGRIYSSQELGSENAIQELARLCAAIDGVELSREDLQVGKIDRDAVVNELARLGESLGKAKISAKCKLKSGYKPATHKILLHGKGEPFDDFVKRHTEFEAVGVTDRVRYSLNWPCHEVELSEELEYCVIKQRKMHDELARIEREYIVPIEEAGVRRSQAIKWLTGGNVYASAMGNINRIAGSSRQEATAAVSCLEAELSQLESELKLLDSSNSATIDYNRLLAEIRLNSAKGLKFLAFVRAKWH